MGEQSFREKFLSPPMPDSQTVAYDAFVSDLEDVIDRYLKVYDPYTISLANFVGRAIMAYNKAMLDKNGDIDNPVIQEREACAKVADDFAIEEYGDSHSVSVCQEIAERIRSRGKENER